jgi:hypothetical protein
MSITKDSFRDWKSNSVTKAVFNELNVRIQGVKDELSGNAGIDIRTDRYRVGYIQALIDLLNIQFDEVENGN